MEKNIVLPEKLDTVPRATELPRHMHRWNTNEVCSCRHCPALVIGLLPWRRLCIWTNYCSKINVIEYTFDGNWYAPLNTNDKYNMLFVHKHAYAFMQYCQISWLVVVAFSGSGFDPDCVWQAQRVGEPRGASKVSRKIVVADILLGLFLRSLLADKTPQHCATTSSAATCAGITESKAAHP